MNENVENLNAQHSDFHREIYRARKKRVLLTLIIHFALFGIVYVVTPKGTYGDIVYLVFALGFNLLVYMWCIYDAAEHSFTLSPAIKVMIILIAALGVPLYLIKKTWLYPN